MHHALLEIPVLRINICTPILHFPVTSLSITRLAPALGLLLVLSSRLAEAQPIPPALELPAIGETVYAAQGDGCWFRADKMEPERVRVDPVEELSAATASTTTSTSRSS